MKLFSILTAAACLLIVSACASTPAPTDERVHVIKADSATDVQAGNIYISAKAAKVFSFRDIESEINENGYLAVRVLGKTAELSALKWAFFGDVDYEFSYRFYWLDADGSLAAQPEAYRLRTTIPGDPVRFVGHAPTEECRDFARVLFMASEQSGDDVAEPSKEADDAVEAQEEADAEAQSAADREEDIIKNAIPEIPEENVSGDAHNVNVIGVPNGSDSAGAGEKK